MLTLFIATVFLAANSVLIYLLIQSRTRVLVSKADWNALKSRALMLDLGDGGTFNQEELAILKQVANEWTAPDQLLSLPPLQIHQHVEVDEQRLAKAFNDSVKRQPGPVKVSNATVTVPPIPKPSQGEKYYKG